MINVLFRELHQIVCGWVTEIEKIFSKGKLSPYDQNNKPGASSHFLGLFFFYSSRRKEKLYQNQKTFTKLFMVYFKTFGMWSENLKRFGCDPKLWNVSDVIRNFETFRTWSKRFRNNDFLKAFQFWLVGKSVQFYAPKRKTLRLLTRKV